MIAFAFRPDGCNGHRPGFEGTFIRQSSSTTEPIFEVEVPPGALEPAVDCRTVKDGILIKNRAGADTSTAQFVQQLLPLCNHHASVQQFVRQHSKYEYGILLADMLFLLVLAATLCILAVKHVCVCVCACARVCVCVFVGLLRL